MKIKPHCPVCHHPGYWRCKAADGRPRFHCDKCEHTWTCGNSGGVWMNYEMGEKEAKQP